VKYKGYSYNFSSIKVYNIAKHPLVNSGYIIDKTSVFMARSIGILSEVVKYTLHPYVAIMEF